MIEVMTLPQSFRRIRLELAREPGHPYGDPDRGYELVMPLQEDGTIDAGLWARFRDHCRAVRFKPGGESEIGRVVRRPGGSWALRYEGEEDEAGYKLGEERFQAGEYVSLRGDEGMHTFRIVSVERV